MGLVGLRRGLLTLAIVHAVGCSYAARPLDARAPKQLAAFESSGTVGVGAEAWFTADRSLEMLGADVSMELTLRLPVVEAAGRGGPPPAPERPSGLPAANPGL